MSYIKSAGKGFLSNFGLKFNQPETNEQILGHDFGAILGKVVKALPDFLVASSGHPAAIINVINDCADITESVSTFYDHISVIGHGYNQFADLDN